jgi:hypothetical protein
VVRKYIFSLLIIIKCDKVIEGNKEYNI